MIDQHATVRVAQAVLRAVDDPGAWQTFLEEFTAALHCDQSSLMVWTPQYEHHSVSCFTGASEEDRREFGEKWVQEDPWMTRVQTDSPEGVFIRSNEITPDEVLVETRIYREFLLPRNWHYGGGVILHRSPSLFSTLTTLRSKEKGPITEEELEWIQMIVPLLQDAAKAHEGHARRRTEHAASMLHVNQLTHGMGIVGEGGEVLMANERLQQIFARGDGLRTNRGCVQADGAAGKELSAALADAAMQARSKHQLPMPKRNGSGAYVVTILPLSPVARMPLGEPKAVATLVVHDSGTRSEINAQILRRMFGLTPAECRLVELLADGMTLSSAAEKLGVSPHTAKTHLKRTFSKTATSRQAELITLALNFSGAPPQS